MRCASPWGIRPHLPLAPGRLQLKKKFADLFLPSLAPAEVRRISDPAPPPESTFTERFSAHLSLASVLTERTEP